MANNPAVPFRDPGNAYTCHASAAVTGKRFVSTTGSRVEGHPAVAHAVSGVAVKPVGVSGYDAPLGGKFTAYCAPGLVMPVTAGVAIVAGQPLYSAADGRATNAAPVAGALIAGYALDDAAVGADAVVKLA